MDFRKFMSKAKIGLLANDKMAFFSHIILGCKHSEDTSPSNETAYTDGLNCYYNPEFFEKLNPNEREFLVAHEGLHIALEHCTERAKGMDPKRWNDAADHVINLLLTRCGMKMPKGGLCDPQYAGLSTLQVYRLMEEQDNNNGGGGNGSNPGNQMGNKPLNDLREPSGHKEQQKREEIKRQVQELAARAKTLCEMNGNMPGDIGADLQRLLDQMLKPQIPWQRVLRRFFHEMIKSDFSWARPNRRYLPHNLYLPSLNGPGLGPGSFAWDESGSVTDTIFNFFVSETHFVLKNMQPPYIDVLQWDDHLRSVDRVKSFKQLLKLEMQGNGGTVVNETIEHFKKSDSRWMVILTDGYIARLSSVPNPGKPVIWAIYDNPHFTPPFGEVVHFKMPDGD